MIEEKNYPTHVFDRSTFLGSDFLDARNNKLDIYWSVRGQNPESDRIIIRFGEKTYDYVVFSIPELESLLHESENFPWLNPALKKATELSLYKCVVW